MACIDIQMLSIIKSRLDQSEDALSDILTDECVLIVLRGSVDEKVTFIDKTCFDENDQQLALSWIKLIEKNTNLIDEEPIK